MRDPVVLVAYASETGSTARIAEVIVQELRAAGLGVACRLAADVDTVAPYDAVVLGSGVYVRSRNSDGGGFLTRHLQAIADRPVWLFSAGPIGRGCGAGSSVTEAGCTVIDVAHAIGARGAAAFGRLGVDAPDDDLAGPLDMARVREWGREIATDVRSSNVGPRSVVTA